MKQFWYELKSNFSNYVSRETNLFNERVPVDRS